MNTRLHIRNTLASAFAIFLLTWLQTARCEEQGVETEVTVEVAQVQKTTLHSYVTGYGYIETEPAGAGRTSADAKISSPVAGVVSEIKCYVGLQVKKGAVLFLLDSRIAEAEVEKAKQAVAFAEKAFARQKDLQKSDATSEKTYQEIENQLGVARSDLAAAQMRLSYYKISAPLSGTITKLNVTQGGYVDSNSPMAEIADLSRLVAAVSIPVSEAVSLKAGQPVELKTEGATMLVTGKLAYFSPGVDAASGTMTVYVTLPADTILKQGQFVKARITNDERRNCLTVPVSSVMKDSEKGWVLSIVADGKATRMQVKTGLRDDGLVEVESEKLKEGMTVVKVGTYGLPDETKVRIIKNATVEK
jgi:membrane fusion protein, multidrug efflux system